MDDEFRLKNALDTAWAVHLATRREVDAADPRRCSLSACWQKQSGRTDLLRPVLSCSVRLRELVEGRMAQFAKALVRLAARSARPGWTLGVIATLIAASIALVLRLAFE